MKKTFYLMLLILLGIIGWISPSLYADSVDDEIDHDLDILTNKHWDRIELQDGTVVKGTITYTGDGYNSIETSDGSVFEAQDNEIYSVDDWDEKPAKPLLTDEELKDPHMKAFLEHYQSTLLGDPMMPMRFSIAAGGDPDLMGLFADPEFVKVLAKYYDHHDIAELKKYPKSKKILDNPRIMEIIEKLTKKDEPPAKPLLTAEETHDPKMQAFMKNYSDQLEKDPTFLKKLRAALDIDPELKDLFKDPEFLKVLANYYSHHDISEIKKYPKSKQILSNSRLMQLIEVITKN